MRAYFTALFFFSFSLGALAQYNKSWKGYFSFNQITDLAQSSNKLIASSENAILIQDVLTGNIKTLNTVDGLSGLTITAVYYSSSLKKILIGYENGLMIVYNEVDGSILYVVDILNKSIPQNVKRVNHFMDVAGIIYVSCDFGVVQYNLNTLQFGDTYFIGPGGSQINISQTTVFNGRIYAASKTNGIFSADLNNPNLNDYNQWLNVSSFGCVAVEKTGINLVAVTNSGNLQRWQGSSFGSLAQLPEVAVDVRGNDQYLLISTANHVLVYNASLALQSDIQSGQITSAPSSFTCANLVDNNLFVGTQQNGIFNKVMTESAFNSITPDGPIRNNVFAITTTANNLWAVYGGYDLDYNPYSFFGFSLPKFGMSKLTKSGWLNISAEEVLNARSLCRIAVNPNNEKQVFVSSYYSGLLKIENDIPNFLYNVTNTAPNGLQTVPGQVPDDIRVNGSVFDNEGNLWMTNSMVAKGIKVLKSNGQWQSYDMQDVVTTSTQFKSGRMIVDKNGTKWMTSWRNGIIGFNEKYNNRFKVISNSADGGNLPSFDTRAVAVDNRNQLWIGTLNGLRVLPSVDSFFSNDVLQSNPIIIVEDGLAQELLYEQSISDIFVDGANNKWIATVDSGVFYVSSDGQKTIYHFTTSNSPLPSNNINDVEANPVTGEVFFATAKGMVSFKGTATEANNNLSNVYVYPNPVRPEYSGTVKISGLTDKAHVKIADIEGNLVAEFITEGGTIEWDTTAFGKYRVASGVYMIFVSSEDGSDTTVKKVMIVR
ncbi:MAG: T9SS type A sorting domain-containing protein [Bacteroidetes bacterium]|nr:T9SS type A sorting domain-containing protein [Bacteroidota bacterium]